MTNCFEMKCPKCGGEDRIDIAATVWVRLTSDGTDADLAADGGHFWEDDSAARCVACDHQGTVKDFETPLVVQMTEILKLIEEWAEEIYDEDSRIPLDLRQRAQAAIRKAEQLA